MSISSHLKSLLQHSQNSLEDISDKLGMSVPRLNELLNGLSPTVQELNIIASYFEVQHEGLLAQEVIAHYDDHIRVVDKVKSNSKDGFFSLIPEPFRVPGFSGENHLVFRVKDDSMSPSLAKGDYLIGESVSNWEDMEDQSLTIVLLKNEILICRFGRKDDECRLISDIGSYDDILFDPAEVTGLWKAVGKVTKDFVKGTKAQYQKSRALTQELKEMQGDLKECYRDFSDFRKSLEN